MNTPLKPARAKAHRPYSAGHDKHNATIVTVAGGTKGTGKLLARGYYYHDVTTGELRTLNAGFPLDVPAFRQRLETMVSRHGYTITHWPKELRP